MSKASEQWLKECRYKAFGLAPKNIDGDWKAQNSAYIKEFLVPATFMVSGLTKDGFDFDTANRCDNSAMQYLASLVQPAAINSLISSMNTMTMSPAWMLYLGDLVGLYKYDGQLTSSLRSVISKYFETHKTHYGVCYKNGTDAMIITDMQDVPLPAYPESTILYSDEYVRLHTVKHGTNTLSNLLHKEFWKYTKMDLEIINSIPNLEESDFALFEIPVMQEDGKVIYADLGYLSKGVPPYEVLSLYDKLPQALVTEYGDPVRALIAYCAENENAIITSAGKDYLNNVKSISAKTQTKPVSNIVLPSASSVESFKGHAISMPESSVMTAEDFDKQLTEAGYVTKSFDETIIDYAKEYGLSKDITLSQLIDFINAPDDAEIPKPFNKDAFKAEIMNGIDWERVEKDAVESSDKVGTARDLLNGWCDDNVVSEILSAMKHEKRFEAPKQESVDKSAVVSEALAEVGIDADTIGRIKIAMDTNGKVETATNTFYDKFEKAGSYMLHEVRKYMSKDSGWQMREQLADAQYAYFRIMMASEDKLDEVIQYLKEISENAPDLAKTIINGAVEVLK